MVVIPGLAAVAWPPPSMPAIEGTVLDQVTSSVISIDPDDAVSPKAVYCRDCPGRSTASAGETQIQSMTDSV